MAIVESLKRLVDPLRVREEEAERRKAREQPLRETDGDPPLTFRCRVCGHTGTEPIFCPECLAETMVRRPR